MLPVTLQRWHHLARRLSAGWLATLLLATLAPAISRALAVGPDRVGPDWVELCTAQGMQQTPAEPGQSALDLCGHCTLATERYAPLLPVVPALAAAPMPWGVPEARDFHAVSRTAPQPAARGPPLRH